MHYSIKTKSQNDWNDEIRFVHYTSDNQFSSTKLSKQLFLAEFAKYNVLTSFQVLILDNLSKVYSFVYYQKENELLLKLANDVEMSLNIDWPALEKIITPCTIAQF